MSWSLIYSAPRATHTTSSSADSVRVCEGYAHRKPCVGGGRLTYPCAAEMSSSKNEHIVRGICLKCIDHATKDFRRADSHGKRICLPVVTGGKATCAKCEASVKTNMFFDHMEGCAQKVQRVYQDS